MKKIILLPLGFLAYFWLMMFLVIGSPNPTDWHTDGIVWLLIIWAGTTAAQLYVHFRGDDTPSPLTIYEVWDNGPHGYYRTKEDAIARMHEVAEERNQYHDERRNFDCLYRWREDDQCYYSRFGALRIVEVVVK